jgi:hypothetical protein
LRQPNLCPLRGQTGNAQNKKMLSALPPLAAGERTFRIGSFVPGSDICTAANSTTIR